MAHPERGETAIDLSQNDQDPEYHNSYRFGSRERLVGINWLQTYQ